MIFFLKFRLTERSLDLRGSGSGLVLATLGFFLESNDVQGSGTGSMLTFEVAFLTVG